MNKMSPELAEIIGLLCAEGSHIVYYSNYWEKGRKKLRYRKNKKSERIEFYNKDIKLLAHYQELLKKEFNYETKVTKHGKVNICNMKVIREIIDHTKLGHLDWRIPESVKKSRKEIKTKFLRGYFDGDGTASSIVRMFSSNPEGIKQISELLNELNFKHTIQGPIIKLNRKPSYVLQLSRKVQSKFIKSIDPISKLPRNC